MRSMYTVIEVYPKGDMERGTDVAFCVVVRVFVQRGAQNVVMGQKDLARREGGHPSTYVKLAVVNCDIRGICVQQSDMYLSRA